MKRFLAVAKRYRFFLLLLALIGVLTIFEPALGKKSLTVSWSSLLQMVSILPPIFILLGLLDVWVPRETMVKYMGEGSGLKGILLAFFLGTAAAGPLYAAFPVAGVLLKKGAKFSNVFIMIGTWSTAKIPQLLFEASALGPKFTLLRLALSIPGIALIALVTEKMLREKDKAQILEKAAGR